MPKIIPALGPRILETAAKHFESKGFEATDMKSLATELGISVGTLYNYYKSKPELFLAVSLVWKQKLSRRILARLDEPEPAPSKLRAALVMLYDDMEAYTGIWKEFLRSGGGLQPGSPAGDQFRRDNEPINVRLQELFLEVWKGAPEAELIAQEPEGRLAKIMVGSIMQTLMVDRDREPNRQFVLRWIDFLTSGPQRNGL